MFRFNFCLWMCYVLYVLIFTWHSSRSRWWYVVRSCLLTATQVYNYQGRRTGGVTTCCRQQYSAGLEVKWNTFTKNSHENQFFLVTVSSVLNRGICCVTTCLQRVHAAAWEFTNSFVQSSFIEKVLFTVEWSTSRRRHVRGAKETLVFPLFWAQNQTRYR